MLIVADNGWCILEGTRQSFHAVCDSILWCKRRHGEMMMPELQSIRDAGALGLFGNNTLAPVMIEGNTDVPRRFATVVPRVAVASLLVSYGTAA